MLTDTPTITVAGPGLGELPGASTLGMARLVCAHGTVMWVLFGPPAVLLQTERRAHDPKRPCQCQPSIAVIYPEPA
jgi:hypothetical protein